MRDGFIVEAISSSVVETATLGYAFLEVTLFVRILSVISISVSGVLAVNSKSVKMLGEKYDNLHVSFIEL